MGTVSIGATSIGTGFEMDDTERAPGIQRADDRSGVLRSSGALPPDAWVRRGLAVGARLDRESSYDLSAGTQDPVRADRRAGSVVAAAFAFTTAVTPTFATAFALGASFAAIMIA